VQGDIVGKRSGRLSRLCLVASALASSATALAAMPDDWSYTPHHPTNRRPAAAIARCADGSWGFAVKRGRVCAGHGAAVKWLRRNRPPSHDKSPRSKAGGD
jgi:hypothetical protein